ncbi:MAG: hypothetical protein NTY22_07590 [Proteobacteria bacterium]|nr:hypothetical protein [Pseudomonadota bacterium]
MKSLFILSIFVMIFFNSALYADICSTTQSGTCNSADIGLITCENCNGVTAGFTVTCNSPSSVFYTTYANTDHQVVQMLMGMALMVKTNSNLKLVIDYCYVSGGSRIIKNMYVGSI